MRKTALFLCYFIDRINKFILYHWPCFSRYYRFKRLFWRKRFDLNTANTGILFTFNTRSQFHKITQKPSDYRERVSLLDEPRQKPQYYSESIHKRALFYFHGHNILGRASLFNRNQHVILKASILVDRLSFAPNVPL